MKTTTLLVEKPSGALLKFVRAIRADKESRQKEILDNWNKYFPKVK